MTVRSGNDFKKQPLSFICNTQDHAAASLSKMTTDCTWTKLTLLRVPSDLTAQNKHDATTQQSSKHDNNINKETEQYNCILERIERIDRTDKIDKTLCLPATLRVVPLTHELVSN